MTEEGLCPLSSMNSPNRGTRTTPSVSPHVKYELWLSDTGAGFGMTANAPLWCVGSRRGWGQEEGSKGIYRKRYDLTGNLLLEANSALKIRCKATLIYIFPPIGKKRTQLFVVMQHSPALLPPHPV